MLSGELGQLGPNWIDQCVSFTGNYDAEFSELTTAVSTLQIGILHVADIGVLQQQN